jgi:hypothetical protein
MCHFYGTVFGFAIGHGFEEKSSGNGIDIIKNRTAKGFVILAQRFERRGLWLM